jgi:uncharacterized membrane protein YoaK (UPF0700 family)
MFRKEGSDRTDRDNRFLAGYLATIAGAVNSAGYVLIEAFTSHVTGNIGRMADDVALGKPDAAALAAVMVTAFFAGAVGASMAVESRLFGSMARTSAALLLVEAGFVAAFMGSAAHLVNAGARTHDLQALLLCTAMGIQNSLVTRLSGAVVRTTHLTGVVTDIAIELARWFRYWRALLGENQHVRLVMTKTPVARPSAAKVWILMHILGGFVVGSAIAAILAVRIGFLALAPVVILLVAGGSFAFASGQKARASR